MAGGHTDTASQAPGQIHHSLGLFAGNFHGPDLTTHFTHTTAVTGDRIHHGMEVRGPKFQWPGKFLMNTEHTAAAPAAGTEKRCLFRVGWLKNQSLFLILLDDGYGFLP